MTDAPAPRTFDLSNAAQTRLHHLIPGGAHTYARGSDQCPEFITPIIERGEGAHVMDLDGNWYVEYGMGLRAVTLGYGYRPVVDAAFAAAAGGTGFSRPSVWELRAAECLLDHVPGADMVKFAKNGSDVTTAAIKLARAATGRDMVAICGTQPFFSVDDWFIGTTSMKAGIPQDEIDRTVSFRYNDLDSVDALLAAYPGRIAALILEQATATAEPAPGFLAGLRERADRDGFLLVFDEMITGLRWSVGGAQAVYGVVPDLSTWGKAIGNGFAVSALAGKREFMELGGLATDRSRVWLLSTTHGGETPGLAALLAVYATYDAHDVVGEMEAAGEKLRAGWLDLARSHGLEAHIPIMGRATCMVFGTKDAEGNPSQPFRTLFLQELLKRGVMSPSLVISWAHTDADIAATLDAADGAMGVYSRALESGSVHGFLEGRPVAPSVREFAAPRRLEV